MSEEGRGSEFLQVQGVIGVAVSNEVTDVQAVAVLMLVRASCLAEGVCSTFRGGGAFDKA